jgi:glutaminyl-peptide cyclotransferase
MVIISRAVSFDFQLLTINSLSPTCDNRIAMKRVTIRSHVPKLLSCLLLASIFAFVATCSAQNKPPTYGYRVVQAYPHDPKAFTQGLIYLNGYLYESTGLEGQSTLRKVDLQTGKVLQRYDLAPDIFGEGLTNWKNTLVQLTWKKETGFVYDRATFHLLRTFHYTGEG